MNNKIKKFIKDNKWIILASIFFLIWKFFLIHTLWQNRLVAPEPDDSYIYVGQIKSVKECSTILCEYPSISFKNTTGFTYLSYRVIFGLLAKIFHLTTLITFHLSFYLGTVLLLPVLIYLTKAFTENKKLIALIIFFLALYNGSGSYHGFFWVVPSFFATMLFLWILGIILNSPKHWYIYLSILLPIFIFMHPTSIYAIVALPFFYIFYVLATKKWHVNILKKILFISTITLFIYFGLAFHIKKSTNIPSLATNIINTKKQELMVKKSARPTLTIPKSIPAKEQHLLSGFKLIKQNYIDWLFPHWLACIPFIIILASLIYFRKFKLLAVYFSLLIFVIISSLHPYGYRSLVFVWPITYILYGMGFWYTLRFIEEKIKNRSLANLAKSAVFISLLTFVILNLLYSYIWNQHTNTHDNIPLNKNCISYLEKITEPTDIITFTSKLLYAQALNSNLLHTPMIIAPSPKSSKYFVVTKTKREQVKKINQSSDTFFNFLALILNKKRADNQVFGSDKIKIPKNFQLIKTFNNTKIYKKTNEIF